MKKWIGFLALSVCLVHSGMAQDAETKGFDKSKLFFGGSLGAAFGYSTIVNVAPLVGYQFSPMFAAGVGLNYTYYSYDDGYTKSKQTYAGMSVFGRFFPIQQFFVQVQPGVNYLWYSENYDNGSNQNVPLLKFTKFVPSLLMGGGAALPAGRGSITFSILYDVLQNAYSPYYHQAVYGVGYNIGF